MHISRCLLESTGKYARPQYNPYNALTQVFLNNNSEDSPNSQPGKQQAPLYYAVKDNICTTQGFTTCASRILGATTDNGYTSPFNATCIELLNAAKCKMIAKTNMDEFGMGSFNINSPYGPTLNPHDLDRTTGGSSGGSAAALLMNSPKLDFTLGTDTGGSVRIPASYCGLVGFKPSYGRISRWGVVPYANSLDTVGIMTTKAGGIDMIQRVFEQLDVYDGRDPTSLKASTRRKIKNRKRNRGGEIRIGIPYEYHIEELSDVVLNNWRHAASHLCDQGCDLIPISLPLTRAALAAYYVLAPSEASSNLQKYSGVFYGARVEPDRLDGRLFAATRSLFGDEVKRRVLMGCLSLSATSFDNYYLQAQRIRSGIVAEYNGVFRESHPLKPSTQKNNRVDYILCPVAPTIAPLLSEVKAMTSAEGHAGDAFTVPSSMAGLPAISVPVGIDKRSGLPVGMQLIGQYGDDEGLLHVARLLLK